MAKEETPTRPIESSDVSVVSVTITQLPAARGRWHRDRMEITVARRASAALGPVFVSAALAVFIAWALHGDATSRSAGARRDAVPEPQRAAMAAAFGYAYPLGCLTITTSDARPDYARISVGRAHECGRYRGYLNASFHRVGGRWRLMLDEGQLFVPNSALAPCGASRGGCLR